jgi:hypothetical protein
VSLDVFLASVSHHVSASIQRAARLGLLVAYRVGARKQNRVPKCELFGFGMIIGSIFCLFGSLRSEMLGADAYS